MPQNTFTTVQWTVDSTSVGTDITLAEDGETIEINADCTYAISMAFGLDSVGSTVNPVSMCGSLVQVTGTSLFGSGGSPGSNIPFLYGADLSGSEADGDLLHSLIWDLQNGDTFQIQAAMFAATGGGTYRIEAGPVGTQAWIRRLL